MIATETISLRVKLGGAIATANSPITGHYVTMTSAGVVIGVQAIHSVTNGVTPVVITPNALTGYVNVLKNLQVSNADSATISVILEQYDGTNARTMSSSPLAINQFLTLDSEGRVTLSASGGIAGTGTVTQVQGNGTVNGLSLSGNITTSGNITLGGTLTGTAPALTAGNVTNIPLLSGAITGNATGTTTLTANGTTSAQLAAALTDKTGTGGNVFANNGTLNTPNITTPSFGNLTNAVGLPLTTGISGVLPAANGGINTAAWVAWTPTFTNLTIGNATVTAFYHRETGSKLVHYRIGIIFGSTSAMGTNPIFTLPVASVAYSIYSQMGYGLLLGSTFLQAEAVWQSTTTAKITYGNPLTTITATIPFTWTTGYEINLHGFYEAA